MPGPSERLEFRWWTPDDLELARGLWGDPRVTARIAGEPFTATEIAARLSLELEQGHTHGVQYWPVFLRDDGSHVGCCGLRPHTPRVYELGFHLRSAFWGRGLAAEAAAAAVAFAFGPSPRAACSPAITPTTPRRAGCCCDWVFVTPTTKCIRRRGPCIRRISGTPDTIADVGESSRLLSRSRGADPHSLARPRARACLCPRPPRATVARR